MQKWLSDQQLRERLGNCSKNTIWRWRKEGKLPAPHRLGSKNVTREDVADKAIRAMIEPPDVLQCEEERKARVEYLKKELEAVENAKA